MACDDGRDDELIDEVVGLLVAMSMRMNQHFAARAAEFDLTAAEGKVLLALDTDQALSMRTVARKLGYDPSNLTGVADKLEDHALVARRSNSTDRRVKTVIPTEHGLAIRQQLSHRLRSGGGPLSPLTHDQLRDLRALLHQANAPGDGR